MQSRTMTILVAVDPELESVFPAIDWPRHEALARRLLEAAGETDAELSIAYVDDAQIRELNRTYRGIDSPTDVLSFSQREGNPVGSDQTLGDIVVSLETAQKQAEKLGHSLDDEMDELLFHGFLHLLGYDHEVPGSDWRRAESSLQDGLRRCRSPYLPQGTSPLEE